MRSQHHAQSLLSQPQAIVNIIEVHGEREFVEAAGGEEHFARRGHAPRRHGAAFVSHPEQVRVSRIENQAVAKRVSRSEVHAEHHACVLHHRARPHEERAYRANGGVKMAREHLFQPRVFRCRDVIVE